MIVSIYTKIIWYENYVHIVYGSCYLSIMLQLSWNNHIILGYSAHCTHSPALLTHRWLDQEDPLRNGCGNDPPPQARTHDKACSEAKTSEASVLAWKSDKHPRKKTGINHWSPLSVLSMFNMIWDFCPDMMHIIKTFFERLVLGVFSGKRRPTFGLDEVKKLSKNADERTKKITKKQNSSTTQKKNTTTTTSLHSTSVRTAQRIRSSWMNV
jgi:hypothetical protein